MAKYVPVFPRPMAKDLCRRCLAAKSLSEAASIIRSLAVTLPLPTGTKPNWRVALLKMADGLDSGKPAYGVFVAGNSKLSFWQFSALPEFTCPGAGPCLKFCYSFKAWRSPLAFARQLQNTLLMKFKKSIIEAAFVALPQDVLVRLYVDGDFDSLATIAFWFRLLSQKRPDIAAFGYSKSWELLKAYADQGLPIAANYVLNVSSGSKYESDLELKGYIMDMPITRGEFLAVSCKGAKKGNERYADPAYHKMVRERVREATGKLRVFSCTLFCDKCMMCAVKEINGKSIVGLPIGNGVH